jgi:hypothetical protein
MSDNAPTVITAAEFVSGGYAQRVAAGECVVRGWAKLEVRDVTLKGDDAEFLGVDNSTWIMANTDKLKLYVEWLPTEAELASLRAQVARYRAALETVNHRTYKPTSDFLSELMWIRSFTDAALAETEEA